MESEQSQAATTEFAEIAEEHRPLLQRVAHRLSGNAETAKDLVQETLLRAWRRFDHFEQGSHTATWLITILTNAYYDQLRHEMVVRKAKPLLEIPDLVECDPAIASVSDADLRAAVDELEPDLRDVIKHCYLKQMSYREVSEALNVCTSTIGTRLMRARARLRELLISRTRDVVKP